MNTFSLSQSKRTPEVFFDMESAELVFNGNSIPEDVNLFYAPLLSWIDQNKVKIVEEMKILTITVNLTYFNSATLKFFVSLLKHLINLKGCENIVITWNYDNEDEDMLETANDISQVLDIPIRTIARAL